MEIKGDWAQGYVLDEHTLSSTFLGNDQYGNPKFDTTRSPIGELLYKLKYDSDETALNPIVEVAVNFIIENGLNMIEGIVSVPPSDTERSFQPVVEVAKNISEELGVKYYGKLLSKIKETPELKSVSDYKEREELLRDAFSINSNKVKGKDLLLLDDLYRSGATLKAVTNVLYDQGKANNVYVLVLTKTRTLR